MYYWLRLAALLLLDAVLLNLAIYFSLWLRFEVEGTIPVRYIISFINLLPWYTAITLICLYAFRLYNRMWEYASTGEFYTIIKSLSTSTLAMVLLIYSTPLPSLPRSVYIMAWILSIALIGGSRMAWRLLRDYIVHNTNPDARPALIVGAGDGGAMVARELLNNPGLGLKPIGFIDDSSLKQRLSLYNIPVLGTREDIPRIVHELNIEEIIIAMPSAHGKVVRNLVGICRETSARLRILHGAQELINGGGQIRPLEVEDLLRREPVQLDLDEIAGYISGQVVMVSGAGGSIGSELCRQIAQYQPRLLVMVEYSENNLFDIENELRENYPQLPLQGELCDIRDRVRLEEVFLQSPPAVVFHAAAYKHVPMMERHAHEALKTNVLGTKNMVEMADRYGINTFILISTDKAVNPGSVMGATKRIAERLVQEKNLASNTQFAAVRFGNVLGSRGSVVNTFQKQIEQGGPVTVTHPDMTRYFMTIPEAVQLVIQAGAMARGGEIFVLDMGEPVRITDLALDMITLNGYEPEKDIAITFSGIRPGEKISEELFTAREQMAATRHELILQCNNGYSSTNSHLAERIDAAFMEQAVSRREDAINIIQEILPEYTPFQNLQP